MEDSLLIHNRIGAGSSSRVFKCTYKDQLYAIKAYYKAYPLQNKMAEAQALEAFEHPNIIKLIFQDQHYRFLILELMQAKSLYYVVLEKGSFKLEMANTLFIKIVHAVKYMHDEGYAHRDIKLENILIDQVTYVPKLSDFGQIAKINQSTIQLFHRKVGTLGYIAPELTEDQVNTEIKAKDLFPCDVFSLGVLYFILVLGHPPFKSTDPSFHCGQWRMIATGNWKKYWQQIGKRAQKRGEILLDSFKDLIQLMLDSNPAKRSSLETILTHPGLQSSLDDAEYKVEALKIIS